MQGVERGRKRLKGALEDPQAISDHEAVVGDRHAGLATAQDAPEHLAPVETAGSTVDDEVPLREIVWEVMPLQVLDVQSTPHVLPQPARDLDAPDVFRDGVVAASLGDQDPGSRLQVVHRERALHLTR